MVLALICLGNNRQDLHPPNCMFFCLQILEAFLWFVLITLLNVTLIILTLSVSRLLNLLLRLVAFRQAHADGWFIVFDTLTLADDRLEAFYDNPNALRDYFRDIGRMVLAAEGRKANDSHADCYQYFCVPEYGTANGRLHFHAVHFMRTLPTGSVDPNFGRR